ncbi:MAG: DMT family protein [Bacteroidia bacterium]|nr:DMT family protein [Bacteroidia bacterium]MDW8159301.1 DMT family protein [Bacteroidia bacterium]
MKTIILLLLSNIFMTFAWYWHLKLKDATLWKVIFISWGIAFFEYCLMIPANRWGYGQFSGAQLKILQEVITLIVFAFFSLFYLKEPITWRYIAAFACILLAVYFMFFK